MSPIIWEGVFETFRDARTRYAEKTSKDAFESQRWLSSALAKTKANQHTAINQGAAATKEKNPLLVLAPQVANERGGVRILEFGGGVGASVPRTLAALRSVADVEITIVDNAASCTLGRSFFAGDDRVIFTDSLPSNQSAFDIIHCESSLQYVDDWRQILEKLTAYQADYILICELLAGKIPSFVSLQVYYEQSIPMRFWNINEFVANMEELDYELNFKANYFPTICGITGPPPMDNFAAEYRLEQFCHLLFSSQNPFFRK